MPYVLLLFGAVLLVSGIRGTHKELWELIKGDFTGNKSFLLWVAAIGVVGGIGYIKPLKGFSIGFMSLLVLVLLLSNKGVIKQLQVFVNNPAPGTPANNNAGITPLDGINSIRKYAGDWIQ